MALRALRTVQILAALNKIYRGSLLNCLEILLTLAIFPLLSFFCTQQNFPGGPTRGIDPEFCAEFRKTIRLPPYFLPSGERFFRIFGRNGALPPDNSREFSYLVLYHRRFPAMVPLMRRVWHKSNRA